MTVSEPLVHDAGQAWTVEDLERIPDDGMRYEIFDGSLVVSPMPYNRHARVTGLILRRLQAQAPAAIFVSGVGLGVNIRGGRSYLIPDVVAVRQDGFDDDALGVDSADVVLVVEVLSPSNPRNDLILKRHEYAADRIPVYWIVDPEKRTITVLEHDGGEHYLEAGVFSAGERIDLQMPFPISLDPAEVF